MINNSEAEKAWAKMHLNSYYGLPKPSNHFNLFDPTVAESIVAETAVARALMAQSDNLIIVCAGKHGIDVHDLGNDENLFEKNIRNVLAEPIKLLSLQDNNLKK